jgi:hypothetical protein
MTILMTKQDINRNEDHSFQGCDALQYRRSSVTFQKKILLPSSGVKCKPSKTQAQLASQKILHFTVAAVKTSNPSDTRVLVTVSQQ